MDMIASLLGHGLSVLLGALLVGIAVGFLIVLPAEMAKERNRSPVTWVLVSLLFSPLAALLLLYALGPAEAGDDR